MSLKPPKKSDAGKSWMKQRQDRKIRLQPEYHLMDMAIKNARLLDAENEGKPPADAAPGTKVFELIEKLKPYLTD